jgi:hypothetical protein
MFPRFVVAVVSDIHYAGPLERARGDNHEFLRIRHPFTRHSLRLFRNHVWLRHPTRQNGQLDRFFANVGEPDLVVANGDLACDAASIGLADEASFESARECLQRLQQRFNQRLHVTLGDHELGKLSLLGERGGLRWESWRRATGELNLKPFWRVDHGKHVLLGLASTLIALPAFARDILAGEKALWEAERSSHLAEINRVFASLQPDQRVLLFCHDPTALPYLWRESGVRGRLGLIDRTIIGHLHSGLVLWKSRLLAGLPVVRFLGGNVERMSMALNEARLWHQFKVHLCPAIAGIELLNDGGFLTLELDGQGNLQTTLHRHALRR